MFTFPTSMFGVGSSTPPPSNPLLEKTFAYFTFDNTTSNLISPDSTGDYRFYFQYDSANYDTGLVGSCVQPNLDGTLFNEMYVQTVSGGEVDSDINFDLPSSGFISMAMWIYPTNFTIDPLYIFGNSTDPVKSDYGLSVEYNSGTFTHHFNLITNDSSDTQYKLEHTTTIIPDDIWLLVGIEVNKVSGEYKIRFNNETPIIGTGVYTSYGLNGSRPRFFNSSSTNGGYKVDRLHFCNAPITDEEWTYLYDSGSGTTTYPFT